MTSDEAWASFMVGLVAAYRRPKTDHNALATHLENLLPLATPRFRAMGATKAIVMALLKTIRSGHASGKGDGMPEYMYATQLKVLRDQMKPAMAHFYVHPDVPEPLARMVRLTAAMLTPDTTSVDKKELALNKTLTVMPDRVLRVMFNPTVKHNQQQSLAESAKLVKRMVGRSDARLAPTETKQAKVDHPVAYRRYLQVRSQIAAAHQDHVRGAAREAGGPVPIGQTIKNMKAEGITYHPYDGLEKLFVGEDGKLYTAKPHRLIIGMPAPGSRIIMNPKYDPKTDDTAVFKYQVPGSKRSEDSMSAAYTRDYLKGRKNARFDLVTKAMQNMPKLRPRWVRDLKSKDLTIQRLAAMTEILYTQAMRPGGTKNNVDGKTTYGLSTLLVNHVTIRNGSAIISYPGKDAIQQNHTISAADSEYPETATVIRILQAAMKGKRGTERVWTDAQGNPISSGDINSYMKGKKLGISAHKFRHIAGTVLMTKLLDQLKIPNGASQQQVEKLVKSTAIQVGALLGHVSGERTTAATSLKSYIHPGLVATFFKDRGLRIPSWVPRAGRGDAEE